ncbi:MAG TPA: AraC family transcriptional regulator [Blastocatellia bacterium]|jgi:AraC-like DNA-binding protein|nr:AraC family transcriptional regulator [Blastocatellia bacterium]
MTCHVAKCSDLTINHKAFQYYPALKKIKTYVERYPERPLTLRKAATIAAMEATHFSKFFHRKIGVSFKHWETVRRVELAISFFDTVQTSVLEAALKAGFNDLTTFERAFKRIKGITPRDYKKHVEALWLAKTA